jgi:pimeloyl-ACP methyl ester carboxylesterase
MRVTPPRFSEPRPGGGTIAYHARTGKPPTVVWLGGFLSDMEGTKATALDAAMARMGQSFLRFDYAGHGSSPGSLADASIGGWLGDALFVLDQLTDGPLILVGSSMGAWIALLALSARPERIAGLALIAPAPDFTEKLLWPKLSLAMQERIEAGACEALPATDERGAFPLTKSFFEDGARHNILDAPIPFAGPVRILHGMMDEDVPWTHALAVAKAIASPDLTLTLVKQGDHRLSTPADLARLQACIAEIISAIP